MSDRPLDHQTTASSVGEAPPSKVSAEPFPADGTMLFPEKRRHPRTRKYGPQKALIQDYGAEQEQIEGTLWDFSYGGLGMEIPRELRIGQEIDLVAEMISSDYSMQIEAHAKVVHCRSIAKKRYRVGVVFQKVQYHRLESKPKTTSQEG
jgi:c-di-GMP-binding flagellar brake protein YcgR